jgi:phosphohistidine phosphatase
MAPRPQLEVGPFRGDVVTAERTVRLLRHATAAPAGSVSSDHQRSLAAEGLLEARILVKEVLDEWTVSLCLCSDALRARQTVTPLAEQAGFPVEYREEIYAGGSQAVIDLIAAVDDVHTEILVVGHNPTMSSVASWLLDTPVHLNTASHATATLPLASWSQLYDLLG